MPHKSTLTSEGTKAKYIQQKKTTSYKISDQVYYRKTH
jgi:hypothetical protein